MQYSCYFVSEELLGASGLLAVVVMGFSMSLMGEQALTCLAALRNLRRCHCACLRLRCGCLPCSVLHARRMLERPSHVRSTAPASADASTRPDMLPPPATCTAALCGRQAAARLPAASKLRCTPSGRYGARSCCQRACRRTSERALPSAPPDAALLLVCAAQALEWLANTILFTWVGIVLGMVLLEPARCEGRAIDTALLAAITIAAMHAVLGCLVRNFLDSVFETRRTQ